MPEDPARALGFYLQRLDVGMPGGDFNRAYDYAKEPAQGGEQAFLHLRLGEILFYLVIRVCVVAFAQPFRGERDIPGFQRSEEHTSELQSLMCISYAVFCLQTQHQTT